MPIIQVYPSKQFPALGAGTDFALRAFIDQLQRIEASSPGNFRVTGYDDMLITLERPFTKEEQLLALIQELQTAAEADGLSAAGIRHLLAQYQIPPPERRRP